MLRLREQTGQPRGLLALGGVMASNNLEYVTREHPWTRKPRDTVKYGRFIIGNVHLNVNPGDKGLHDLGSPQQQHASLLDGSAALHLTASAPDFTRHYDLFYPEKLPVGQRLHSVFQDPNPNEQHYHTPPGWPKEQPVLYRVYDGEVYEPVLDLSEEPNIARIYTALDSRH